MHTDIPVFVRIALPRDGEVMTKKKRFWIAGTASIAAALLAGCTATSAEASPSPVTASTTTSYASSQRQLDVQLEALEHSYQARIGVTAIDTGTGRTVSYRGGERFAFDSTGKVFTASNLLSRDTEAQLDTTVHYTTSELQSYSPITSQHVATGMTVNALIGAALQYSDNTAANLLFAQAHGPAQVQAWLREHGDHVTNVNRTEPTLNSAVPGDRRDTTTPNQEVTDLGHLALGHWLSTSRRSALVGTMLGNTTGTPYIRAGVPSTWKVADKTGNGDWGTRNDVAVVYPPRHAPVIIAIYTSRFSADASSSDDLIQRTATDAIEALGLV